MDITKYLEAFKLFRITGPGYIVVIGNMLYGIDINFNALYVTELPEIDTLPYDKCIANRTDLISENFYYDIRVYNMLLPYISHYVNNNIEYRPLDDTYFDEVYRMKSSSKSEMKMFHDQRDIRSEYLLPIFYKMYPMIKEDSVQNFIFERGIELLFKSIITKKKQKRIITVYRRFLNVDTRYQAITRM